MTLYDRPVWALMADCARDLPEQFGFADVRRWFRAQYPSVQDGTIRAHMLGLTEGRNPDHFPFLSGKPPLFRRVGHGTYQAVWRRPRAASAPAPAPAATPTPSSASSANLYLVGCVKSKLSVPAAARDLYVSPLFTRARARVEAAGHPWFILSAEHGLVKPDEWLSPYDRYLPQTDSSYRAAWGSWVVARLQLLYGGLDGRTIEVHASRSYVDPIRHHLARLGAVVLEPLNGLSMGGRLAWYTDDAAQEPVASTHAQHRADGPADDLTESLVAQLMQADAAIRPVDLQRRSPGLGRPGLYSWWVDERGAAELSAGLDLPVAPGLIYSGLAGATKWPSGTTSANTLAGRLLDMHLVDQSRFSTFRLTLAAILFAGPSERGVDEAALTQWMRDHLRVVAVPYDDRDRLGEVESKVLRVLDPPLNLGKVGPTPVRRRLTVLRRQLGVC